MILFTIVHIFTHIYREKEILMYTYLHYMYVIIRMYVIYIYIN
jgi:hypothetical protein